MNQGVHIPQSQLRSEERRTPNTVFHTIPVEMVAVEYANEHGVVIKEFWYKMGDRFYIPPQAEEFANKVREVKPEFAAQARARYQSATHSSAGIPSTDSVDVVSEQTAKEVG